MRQLVRSWPRLAALFFIVVSSSTIHAATLTVMNTDDDGPGSLREAIALASAGDHIQFDPSLADIL